MTINDATRAQIEAARPDASTWLTANAGSGKTRVLTDRVARLLLENVEPQQILCLTYTKAAASEMQNRLFKRLGEWAMLEDAPLKKSLADLGFEREMTPEALRGARTLFARAIETPGGLKIQTIHSFCAAILRRFPLEAGVSPQFSEIEDRAADLLRADIVDEMAESDGAALVADLAHHYTGEDFAKLTKAIIGMRDAFTDGATLGDLLALFDQPPNLTRDTIEGMVFDGNEADLITQIIPALLAKGGNDAKAALQLGEIATMGFGSLPELERIFLTGAGAKSPYTAKIGTFPTKDTRAVLDTVMPALEDFMQRVEEARDARLALTAATRSLALHRFARSFIARYESAKQQRGWLDFDDLILRTRALLSDPKVAAWVLYRIDGGIDHILVDEAQDTSPRQWDVIETLTDEFFSGTGARPQMDRTLFVVGDKKQSIYSFQGADPEEFDRKAITFEKKVRDAQQIFQHRSLDYSFRSSSAILRMVDQTFDPRVQEGLDKETQHIAFKEALPGRIDLWPVVDKAENEDDLDWTDPLDRRSAQHHDVILAEQIAARIKALIEDEQSFIPADAQNPDRFVKRRIRAGDFLILVQRRSGLFSEIIRACKAAELPIAGADRLKVGAELAVKDLAALLSFLATPDDSLSLATALKSPLFGWTEQMLFSLAHYRSEDHLWQALRTQETEHANTVAMLRDLRGQVDFLRPYDLIERILTRHQGRKHLLERLGPEAEDGINAMLSQALSYERTDVPSLTGFLQWMQTDDLEIKRQVDNSSDQIRVMTVHGAKGLESPIVILPDTGRRDIIIKDEIVSLSGVPIWRPNAAETPRALSERIDDLKAAQFRERLRLLYVAMTRAEKWLIIAASGDLAKDGSDWFQITGTAMGHINGVAQGDEGTIRFEEGGWDDLPIATESENPVDIPALETFLCHPVVPFAERQKPLSPSNLKGAKALPGDIGEDRDDVLSYGSLVHALLEDLAQVDPAHHVSTAERHAALVLPEVFKAARQEAIAVLQDTAFGDLFGPNALAEVPLTAQVNGIRMHGSIDRLLLDDTRIRLVDFKTNRVVPQSAATCPQGLLAQMGAYAAMLAQIYPDREIETAILWTATRQLMPLPHDMVSSAFIHALELDDAGARS
ncbi:MAG: double-strand break repair helicase AddA [Sulfitobacter sp.]